MDFFSKNSKRIVDVRLGSKYVSADEQVFSWNKKTNNTRKEILKS